MSIELEVFCTCGNELGATYSQGDSGPVLEVEPCTVCLQERHDQGYEEGLEVGSQE